MSLVASTVPNLVSGVSQQPAPSRLRTSGSEMINGFPTVVSGLMKRPPSEFITNLGFDNVPDDAAIHTIDRSAAEKFVIVASSGDLKMYDQFGTEQTVTFPNGKSYLPTSDMWRKMRFVTVADTTFVLNTDQVALTTALPDARINPVERATVFIRQAVAAVTYRIRLDGVVVAEYTTRNNTSAAQVLEGTSEIAQGLASAAFANGFAAFRIGSSLTFPVTAGQQVTVDDQFGGRAVTAYTDTVQEFTDLPPVEQALRPVKVAAGLDDGAGGSYWVEFIDGVWEEVNGYNANLALNPASMPHILQRQSDGTFQFKQAPWVNRDAGDDDSNPAPSFIGQRINNIFLFKGRLGFLSGENVVMSEVTVLENLFRTTVIQLLDSDPIDVASTTGRVSTLYHAASFSDELVLFSDKQQFRLSSGDVLSPETVGITNSTAYPCSLFVSPVTVGSSAYFVSDGATHSLAREIFIDESRETVNGEDIGVQVPTYIPLNIRTLTASSQADVFLALSENERNTVYVYKWYATGERKVQSAWCKWVFDESVSILGMGFLDNYLYMVYKVGVELRMDRLLVGPNIDREYLLDQQYDEDDVVFSGLDGDAFLITIPYSHAGDDMVFISKTTGEPLTYTKLSDTSYRVVGTFEDGFVGGLNYEFRYEYSTQYLREENADGESAVQDGRLQMRYYSQIYTDTSYFEGHVTQNGTTKVTVFNGRTLADPDNITDVIPRDTGEFRFPILGENEQVKVELVSNQPYRCAFGSLEWTAVYKPRARRVR